MNREANCICGHTLDDHHVSWWAGSPEPYAEECEFYGFNEYGGAMPDPETGKWKEHCNKFVLCKCGCNDR